LVQLLLLVLAQLHEHSWTQLVQLLLQKLAVQLQQQLPLGLLLPMEQLMWNLVVLLHLVKTPGQTQVNMLAQTPLQSWQQVTTLRAAILLELLVLRQHHLWQLLWKLGLQLMWKVLQYLLDLQQVWVLKLQKLSPELLLLLLHGTAAQD